MILDFASPLGMYWIPKHLSRYCTTYLPYISRRN
nr:MAG TPA: hypothetical protein [Bacteriophage sp.]